MTQVAAEWRKWPVDGGLLDQTAWFVAALNIVSQARALSMEPGNDA